MELPCNKKAPLHAPTSSTQLAKGGPTTQVIGVITPLNFKK